VSLLRRMVGPLPDIEPLTSDDQAWRALSAELHATPRRHLASWMIFALGAMPAAALALVLFLRAGVPSPVEGQSRATVASTATPPAPARPAAAAPTTHLEALGAALSVSDGRRATVVHGSFDLAAGMGVATAKGEGRLSLPGGSLALLEPDSALGAARLDPDGVELTLASGGLFVHAAKMGEHGSLVVRAGDYRVVVHGTGFRVERRRGEVSVALWHGSVEVRSDFDSRGVFLAPGQKLRFDEARGPAGAVAKPLGEAEAPGAAEEARLLGAVPPVSHVSTAGQQAALVQEKPEPAQPPQVMADVARCRAQAGAKGEGPRLDLTLDDDGKVTGATIEHPAGLGENAANAKFASCVAEAALGWKLDPPPPALRGMQFIYPIK
jgi:ferric-dicitrate binding protein FerR (iron transport regulator)